VDGEDEEGVEEVGTLTGRYLVPLLVFCSVYLISVVCFWLWPFFKDLVRRLTGITDDGSPEDG
jgi:hypothetical protein